MYRLICKKARMAMPPDPLPLKQFHFATIESTNDWAKEHCDKCLKNGITLITADAQTSGRGRYSRHWLSPPGQNLCATYVFFLKDDSFDRTPYVQLMAKAVQKMLQGYGLQAEIKWPNDVMISGKKISGILCEIHPVEESSAIIIGVGLNVNMAQELLDTIDQPATSLLVETSRHFSIEDVTRALTKTFYQELLGTRGLFSPFSPSDDL